MNKRIAYWVTMGVVVAGTASVVLLQDNTGSPTAGPVAQTTTAPPAPNLLASAPGEMPQSELRPTETIETELVNGIRVRKDRSCTTQIHYIPRQDGTVSEAHSCKPNGAAEEHPYESYSSEALLSLAYSDGVAAEILGLRLRESDLEMAMSLIIRATALSGNHPEIILNFSDSYPHPSGINGVPVPDTVRDKYIMSVVAKALGAEVSGHNDWSEMVTQTFEKPDAVMSELDEQAWDLLVVMHDIQMEVTGESSIHIPEDFRNEL